jgi:hypothetical protein|tara:strand:+ start:1203 stop:1421 length:219 start_codon:yes stop_codon:yes gene_type:complete
VNWLEIDKFLIGLIRAAKNKEQVFIDAMKKFDWNQSQANAAINPLLKWANFENKPKAKTTAKPKPKPKTRKK